MHRYKVSFTRAGDGIPTVLTYEREDLALAVENALKLAVQNLSSIEVERVLMLRNHEFKPVELDLLKELLAIPATGPLPARRGLSIRWVRTLTGAGLKETRDFLEELHPQAFANECGEIALPGGGHTPAVPVGGLDLPKASPPTTVPEARECLQSVLAHAQSVLVDAMVDHFCNCQDPIGLLAQIARDGYTGFNHMYSIQLVEKVRTANLDRRPEVANAIRIIEA